MSAAATEVFRLWKSKFKNDPASENKREHGDDNPVDVKRQKKNPVDDTPGDLLSSVSILSDEKSTTANKMTVLKKLLKASDICMYCGNYIYLANITVDDYFCAGVERV